MRRTTIHNPRARCARGLTFRSMNYKRTLRRRLPRDGLINRCAMSILARPTSLLALCIAESWTYLRQTRPRSTIWSVKPITSSAGRGPDILDMKRRPPPDGGDSASVQWAGQQRLLDSRWCELSTQGRRRGHYSGWNRALVHEDRRSHHLSDDAHRPRQGDTA